MKLSFFVYVFLFAITGILVPIFINLIGGNVKFLDMNMWVIFGFAFFFERFGAMHIQLYSITNKIIWHIANGISGSLYLLSSLLLYNFIGIISFPIGMLLGYLSFYSWYSAHAFL